MTSFIYEFGPLLKR